MSCNLSDFFWNEVVVNLFLVFCDKENDSLLLLTQLSYCYRCNTHSCPRHGGFGQWSVFTPCSVTCGRGVAIRRRECNNPVPMYGGNGCGHLGRSEERRSCMLKECGRGGVVPPCKDSDHVYCERYSSPERTRLHYCRQRWTRNNCPSMCNLCTS